MTIGPAVRVDATRAADLAALHAHAFDLAWDAASLGRLLEMPGACALAVEAGRPAAIAGFVVCRAAADEAEIVTLVVDPALRRRGIGRQLVEAVLSTFARGATRRVYLEVAIDNGPAIALYEACGFARAGERRSYYHRAYAPPVDALVLVHSLTA